MAENLAKAKHHPEAELLIFEDYFFSLSTVSCKNDRRYSKKCTKNEYVSLNEVTWLMPMRMRLKMKNRWYSYDSIGPRARHGQKYTKYKMCLSIMMVVCNKQQISSKINSWKS